MRRPVPLPAALPRPCPPRQLSLHASPASARHAVLPQVKRYDLVIQLSEEGAGLGAAQIRASSRDTLREVEQDMALATALAQVCANARARAWAVARRATAARGCVRLSV